MTIDIWGGVDLKRGMLVNACIPLLVADPAYDGAQGLFWIHTPTGRLSFYDAGGTVRRMAYGQMATADIADGAITPDKLSFDTVTQTDLDDSSAADRDRANHIGTQLAATISDFNAAVQVNRLDQLADPNVAVSFPSGIQIGNGSNYEIRVLGINSGLLSFDSGFDADRVSIRAGSLVLSSMFEGGPDYNEVTLGVTEDDLLRVYGRVEATPAVDPSELATLGQVQSAIEGMRRTSVRIASTGNVNGSVSEGGTVITQATPPFIIDGLAPADGDLLLLKNQTAPAMNGIYVKDTVPATGGAILTRASWANTASEIDGILAIVEDGTQAGTMWYTVSDPTTIGTDAITFTQFNSATDIVAGDGLTKSGNTLNVSINESLGLIFSGGEDLIGVNVDDTSIGVNGTNELEVKDGSVDTTKLTNGAVDETKMEATFYAKLSKSHSHEAIMNGTATTITVNLYAEDVTGVSVWELGSEKNLVLADTSASDDGFGGWQVVVDFGTPPPNATAFQVAVTYV